MKERKKYWISDSIEHPGSLRKELHIKKGKKITKAKLKKAVKAKGKEGKRARLAMTLLKLRKKKMKKVMKEFQKGDLHSGSKMGTIVTNPKQAVAIGYSEARRAVKRRKIK